MVYLTSFYGAKRKKGIQTLIHITLLIIGMIVIYRGLWEEPDLIGIFLIVTMNLLAIISINHDDKYRLVRDSMNVLTKDFPPGFDTQDLYLHLDWVWPTIETHLHQDHLFIIQTDHFLIENLNDIDWIYTVEGRTRFLWFLYLEVILKNGKRRAIRLPHSTDMDAEGMDRTRLDLNDLMKYINEHYPHIQTGITKDKKREFLRSLPWYRRLLEWIYLLG